MRKVYRRRLVGGDGYAVIDDQGRYASASDHMDSMRSRLFSAPISERDRLRGASRLECFATDTSNTYALHNI